MTSFKNKFLSEGLVFCILFLTLQCVFGSPLNKRGCTAPFLLPQKPFLVVWNHPSSICEKHGITIDFAKWGMVENSRDSFIGKQISLLYRPGKWPYYSQNEPVNGGIPQLGNLSLHLESLKSTISSEVLDQDFSGLGVIDFENWRPLYQLNFDSLNIYQKNSLELAKERHPSYNKSQVLNEAIKEFENTARLYMSGSLKTATNLRPNGQWGYYGYPRCWDKNCNSSTISINDRMNWVFKASSGLFPSIYFHQTMSSESRADMITKRLTETLRVKAKWTSPDIAIFPYALCQDGPYSFFTKHDLDYSVKLPADLGSSGILLWGSSSMFLAKDECILLQDYVNSTLGPYSKQVMDFSSNCSSKLCSGHGRCVRKNYEAVYQSHMAEAGHKICTISPDRLQMSHTDSGRLQENKMLKNPRNEFLSENTISKLGMDTKFFPILVDSDMKQTSSQLRILNGSQDSGKKKDWYIAIQHFIITLFKSISWLIDQNQQYNLIRDIPSVDSLATYSSDKNKPQDLPSGNSRSVDVSKNQKNPNKVGSKDFSSAKNFDNYICKCFAGWTGKHCDITQK